ncbi:hypothetical protein [Nocardia abscessus]|uniref:hypothetical protein n=1 Tax=Nocardia abscessus TaxID=120957 RepID=UPI0014614813|nr:hypothetical protein [Nocardia abscessus]MCC3331156.1 hypothetical protein [Nocardia abscessus]
MGLRFGGCHGVVAGLVSSTVGWETLQVALAQMNANAASPTAYTSGCEIERIVPSTTICPVSDTAP